MISTELDFALINGEVVKLTLNFELLLKIKNKYPDEYEEFSKIVLFGDRVQEEADLLKAVQVIYVSYLCANFESEKMYSKDAFIKLIPFDFNLINRVQKELLGIKKK